MALKLNLKKSIFPVEIGDFKFEVDLSDDKAKDFEEKILDRHFVEFSYQPSSIGYHYEIEFNTKQQPAFNRQFDMLIRDLKHWEKSKFQLFLFAENPKQLERLYSIFNDLKAEINFNPIATAIHEGFIDEDLKIVCYTDHEIFQRYHKYNVRQAYNKSKAITLRTLRELQPGDYVTHIDHGVGVFSGLQKIPSLCRCQIPWCARETRWFFVGVFLVVNTVGESCDL